MTARQGWVVYNGNLMEHKFIDTACWFHEAAQRQGLNTTMVKNNELLPMIQGGQVLLAGPYAGIHPDFVIFLDKDIRLAAHLEKMGIRVFNSSSAIAVCDDKALTYQVLAGHQVPMPRTILAPKVFHQVNDFAFCDAVIKLLGIPMLIKEVFGSFGQQVYLINTWEELIARVADLGSSPYVFQELVSSSYGRDVRLQVVGTQVVAAMLRESRIGFRANVTAGAAMCPYHPSRQEIDLALACCRIIGLDFAGVDLLFGPDGPLVSEVNSNAHIHNLFDCTGINAADAVAAYIFNRLESEI